MKTSTASVRKLCWLRVTFCFASWGQAFTRREDVMCNFPEILRLLLLLLLLASFKVALLRHTQQLGSASPPDGRPTFCTFVGDTRKNMFKNACLLASHYKFCFVWWMQRSAQDSPHSKDLQKTNRNSWSVNRNDQIVWFVLSPKVAARCTVLVCRIGCVTIFFVLKILVNEYPPKGFPFLFLQILKYQLTQLTKRPTRAFEVMWLKTTCFLVTQLYYLCCVRWSQCTQCNQFTKVFVVCFV